MFMELFSINERECKNLELFNQEVIDHTYIKHEDCLNYYLICHGFEDGTIIFNECIVKFEDLEEVVKEELNIPKNQCLFIDVISCHGSYLRPYMKENFRMKSLYSEKSEIYYELSEDKESLIVSDSPYICKENRICC